MKSQKQQNNLCFQGKPFNITVIQVYAPTSNTEEAEVKWSYEDLQDSARFGSTYTKIGTIQRRLAWPLHKDDTQIREAFHIFPQINQCNTPH